MNTTVAATQAAMASPLHIPSVGPVTGLMALTVAGILVWRTWLPRLAGLFSLIAGAGLAASWVQQPLASAVASGPQWVQTAPWIPGLVASVFLLCELLPTKQVRAGMLAEVKRFHHFNWTNRGQAEKITTHAVAFVYPVLAGVIPGKAGHVVSTVINLVTAPLTAGLHSWLGVA